MLARWSRLNIQDMSYNKKGTIFPIAGDAKRRPARVSASELRSLATQSRRHKTRYSESP